MKRRIYLLAAVAAGTLALTGCKKDASNKEITLPEGQVYLGAQWADGELWVESLDPKAMTCTFSQYQDGKSVEATAITLKNCRTGMIGPMRSMMPGRPGMMPRPDGAHPGMMMPRPDGAHPGMMPPPDGVHPGTMPPPDKPSAVPPAGTAPPAPPAGQPPQG